MDADTLENIDPALGHMAAFSKATGNITRQIHQLRESAIFSDGVLPARHKALIAALWSVSARCEPCLQFYMIRARELGATATEVGEVLAIAPAMGGCVGETWVLKAFAAFTDGEAGDREAACCVG